MGEAEEIYQRLLDRLSSAVVAGDTATVLCHISLPFHLSTLGGQFTLTTEAEIADHCLTLTRTLRQLGATDYIRLVSGARFLEPGLIEGTHVTHMLRRADRVVEPFSSRMLIADQGGAWRVRRAVHALENHRLPIEMPRPARRSDLSPPAIVP